MKSPFKTKLFAALAVPCFLVASPAAAQFNQEPSAFVFNTNAFWLNLHHFLYVLGRAHTNASDATQSAVAGAILDEEHGLASLSPQDAATWRRAVDQYGAGASGLDITTDATMIASVLDLAAQSDSVTLLPTTHIDAKTRDALESAAPLYRRSFWIAHQTANRRFEASMQAFMKSYQRPVLSLIARGYGRSWPGAGRLIYLTPYTTSEGAYAVEGFMVMSSAAPEMRGGLAFETGVVEAMHQWDDGVMRRLQTAGAAKRVPVDEWLSQGLIYYTSGEAFRRVVPGHVPYATKFHRWAGHEKIRQALDAAWLPWLNGTGSLEDALAALIVRASNAPPPPAAKPRKRR